MYVNKSFVLDLLEVLLFIGSENTRVIVMNVSFSAHDTDQWVMMVADLMKTFPNYALFNLDEISETAEEPFGDVLKELTKIVKKSSGESGG